MKNKNWRRIALISFFLFHGLIMLSLGVIISINYIFNIFGDIIVKIFQLTPEQAAGFFNELNQHMADFLR